MGSGDVWIIGHVGQYAIRRRRRWPRRADRLTLAAAVPKDAQHCFVVVNASASVRGGHGRFCPAHEINQRAQYSHISLLGSGAASRFLVPLLLVIKRATRKGRGWVEEGVSHKNVMCVIKPS